MEHKEQKKRKEKIKSMLSEIVNEIDEQIKEDHESSLRCWNKYENEIDIHRKVDAWQEYQYYLGRAKGLWDAKRLLLKRRKGIDYEFDW